MKRRRPRVVLARYVLAAVLGAAAAGCAETQFLLHGAKEITGSADEAPPTGTYKVGAPYSINGIWYYPKEDPEYRETGIASWYGPGFHGNRTANGEIFDMNKVSAAHRTLPMPSAVQVTNLDNGRSIKVRVNDRGPFAHGRIIDLSRRAAQLLGFEQQGTAKVEVTFLSEESRQLAAAFGVGSSDMGGGVPQPAAAPRTAVASRELPAPEGARSAPPPTPGHEPAAVREVQTAARIAPPIATELDSSVSVVAPAPGKTIYVQAGAFSRYENANRMRAYLASVGDAHIDQVRVKDTPLFRVRLGPLASVADADRVLEAVMRTGHADARIVLE